MAEPDVGFAEEAAVPEHNEARIAFRRAAARVPAHRLPPDEHTVWWDRGVWDGVETAMIYAEEAMRTLSAILDAGDIQRARAATAIFGQLFSTSQFPRRADGRIDETGLTPADAHVRDVLDGVDADGTAPSRCDVADD